MNASRTWMCLAVLSAQWASGADLILVGPHPTSVLTPFPALHSLKAHAGRIYMGYGDWNQYPVAVIASYDPSSNAFRVEYSAPTDSLDHFRSIGGRLYAPSLDPVHYEGFQDFSVREAGRWRSFAPGGFLHVFDVDSVTGSDLWFVGSKLPSETATSGGAVMRSLDGGRTWTDVTPVGPNGGRFYYGFALRGRFYVQGYAYDGDVATPSTVPHTYLRAVQVGEGMSAYIVGLAGRVPGFSDGSVARPLVTFDGSVWRTLTPAVQNFTVENSTLYALMSNRVWRASSQSVTQVVWEALPITGIAAGATVIEVVDGVCYVGDAAGRLWAARLDGIPLLQSPATVINELPDLFGQSMALSGEILAVGAPDYSGGQHLSGQVTIWERMNSIWSRTATLDPPQPMLSGWFGRDVALFGQFMAVLESGRDRTGFSRGSDAQVHLYRRDATGWQLRQSVTNPFAHSVALDGDRLAIATTTSLRLYRLSETNLAPAILEISLFHSAPGYEPIGRVALDGESVAYGLSGDPSRGGGPGQVNVYERNSQGAWPLIASLRRDTPPLPAGVLQHPDAFGFAASLKNGWLAVGAPRDDTVAAQAGAVHLYQREQSGSNATYTWRQTVLAPVAQSEARFGAAVSLTDSRLLVGAPGIDTIERQHGRVFVYEMQGAEWTAAGEIVAPSGAQGQFGAEVLATPTFLLAGCQSASGATELTDRVAIAINPDLSEYADLVVAQVVSPVIITNGSPLTFSITVTNKGPAAATSVALAFATRSLNSASLQIDSIESNGFACTNTGTEVRCTLDQLAPGSSESLMIHGQASLTGSCGWIGTEASTYARELDANIVDNRALARASSEPPQVVLTSPPEGTNLPFRGSVQIAVQVASISPIASVSIYTNNVVMKIFNAPPYTNLWANIPSGRHDITVRVLDSCGIETRSASWIQVATNRHPVVTLLSPVGGTRFPNTNHIPIYVSAFDPDGGRTVVDIYRNFTRLRILVASPFVTTWMDAPVGIHSLHAVAYDLNSAATTSSVARIHVGPELSVGTNWIAFNDHSSGPATVSAATRWNILGASPGPGGVLRSVTNGATLPVWLAITRSSTLFSSELGANPDPDTPALRSFGDYVDFVTGPSANVGIVTPGWVRYEFRGLDPNLRYHFKGTAVGGNPAYTNRWTQVELVGVRAFDATHTLGCLTEGVGSIRSNQVALNTGFNLSGDMVSWDNIQPGHDGTLTIICSQYTGLVPGGSSGGSSGNALTAARLEEVNVPVAPSPSIVGQPVSVTTSPGAAAQFSVAANGAGPFSYQWLRNNTVMAGATAGTIEFNSVSTNDVGRFSAVVTGETGSTVSEAAVLTLFTLDTRTNIATSEVLAWLTLFGPVGQNYSAEFSDALGPSPLWSSLANVTLSTNWATVVDAESTNQPSRFYRVIPRP